MLRVKMCAVIDVVKGDSSKKRVSGLGRFCDMRKKGVKLKNTNIWIFGVRIKM